MPSQVSLTLPQIVVEICLFLVSAIAIFGGFRQMYLGEPNTSPRLDNLHRFMGGVYMSTGLICLWAALTIRQQHLLVYLIALGVLLGGIGRLISILKVGLPEPKGLWLAYLISELIIPVILTVAHYFSP